MACGSRWCSLREALSRALPPDMALCQSDRQVCSCFPGCCSMLRCAGAVKWLACQCGSMWLEQVRVGMLCDLQVSLCRQAPP